MPCQPEPHMRLLTEHAFSSSPPYLRCPIMDPPRLSLGSQLHGYIPDSGRGSALVSFGVFMFTGGRLMAKWIAITSLASASSVVAISWLMVECLGLGLLRCAVEGQFILWVKCLATLSTGT